SFVHVNAPCRNGDRLCHFASSAHRLSFRLSAVIDSAAPLGCSPLAAKHASRCQPSHASVADLPGPVHAFMHSLRLGFAAPPSRTSASLCHSSGSTPKLSRTNLTGSARHCLIRPCADLAALIRPPGQVLCRPPAAQGSPCRSARAPASRATHHG